VLKRRTGDDDSAALTMIPAKGQLDRIPAATRAIDLHHGLVQRAPSIRTRDLPCFTISSSICARLALTHQDVFDREVVHKQGLVPFGRRGQILRNGRGMEQIGGDGRKRRRGVLRELTLGLVAQRKRCAEGPDAWLACCAGSPGARE